MLLLLKELAVDTFPVFDIMSKLLETKQVNTKCTLLCIYILNIPKYFQVGGAYGECLSIIYGYKLDIR
jgi:hypothetical protein